jgi:hypothetical protein
MHLGISVDLCQFVVQSLSCRCLLFFGQGDSIGKQREPGRPVVPPVEWVFCGVFKGFSLILRAGRRCANVTARWLLKPRQHESAFFMLFRTIPKNHEGLL